MPSEERKNRKKEQGTKAERVRELPGPHMSGLAGEHIIR